MSQRHFMILICAVMTIACLTAAAGLWEARSARQDCEMLRSLVLEQINQAGDDRLDILMLGYQLDRNGLLSASAADRLLRAPSP
jgi:hypothetical protein